MNDEGLLLPDTFELMDELDEQLIDREFKMFSFRQIDESNTNNNTGLAPSNTQQSRSYNEIDEIAEVILQNTGPDSSYNQNDEIARFVKNAQNQPQSSNSAFRTKTISDSIVKDIKEMIKKEDVHQSICERDLDCGTIVQNLKPTRADQDIFNNIHIPTNCHPNTRQMNSCYNNYKRYQASTSGVSNESSSVSHVDSWLDDLMIDEKSSQHVMQQNEIDAVDDFNEYDMVSFGKSSGSSFDALSLQKVAYPFRNNFDRRDVSRVTNHQTPTVNKFDQKICSLSGSIVKRVSKSMDLTQLEPVSPNSKKRRIITYTKDTKIIKISNSRKFNSITSISRKDGNLLNITARGEENGKDACKKNKVNLSASENTTTSTKTPSEQQKPLLSASKPPQPSEMQYITVPLNEAIQKSTTTIIDGQSYHLIPISHKNVSKISKSSKISYNMSANQIVIGPAADRIQATREKAEQERQSYNYVNLQGATTTTILNAGLTGTSSCYSNSASMNSTPIYSTQPSCNSNSSYTTAAYPASIPYHSSTHLNSATTYTNSMHTLPANIDMQTVYEEVWFYDNQSRLCKMLRPLSNKTAKVLPAQTKFSKNSNYKSPTNCIKIDPTTSKLEKNSASSINCSSTSKGILKKVEIEKEEGLVFARSQ